MSNTNEPTSAEDIKGRVKEAAGVVVGNEDLKKDGKADQASAGIKDVIEKIGDKAEDLVDRAKDAFQNRKDKD